MKRFIAWAWCLAGSVGLAAAGVNVNTASTAELQKLKGIDARTAQAIVDYRTKHGPFRSIDDLDKVPGIGKPTLTAIKKDVTFSGASTGIAPMKEDNRAADRSDARVQRPDPNRFGKTAPGG